MIKKMTLAYNKRTLSDISNFCNLIKYVCKIEKSSNFDPSLLQTEVEIDSEVSISKGLNLKLKFVHLMDKTMTKN